MNQVANEKFHILTKLSLSDATWRQEKGVHIDKVKEDAQRLINQLKNSIFTESFLREVCYVTQAMRPNSSIEIQEGTKISRQFNQSMEVPFTVTFHAQGDGEVQIYIQSNNLIAEGNFTKVYKATQIIFKSDKFQVNEVAKLSITTRTNAANIMLLEKIAQLDLFKSYPNVLKIHAWASRKEPKGRTKSVVYIPLYDGNLTRFIKKVHTQKNSECNIQNMLKVSEALAVTLTALHDHNCIFENINPNNLLIKYKSKKIAETHLSNLDVSYFLSTQNDPEKTPGKFAFKAPEWFLRSIDGRHLDRFGVNLEDFGSEEDKRASDMWGVGCILYMMYFKKLPKFCQVLQRLECNETSKQEYEVELTEITNALSTGYIKKLIESMTEYNKGEYERLIGKFETDLAIIESKGKPYLQSINLAITEIKNPTIIPRKKKGKDDFWIVLISELLCYDPRKRMTAQAFQQKINQYIQEHKPIPKRRVSVFTTNVPLEVEITEIEPLQPSSNLGVTEDPQRSCNTVRGNFAKVLSFRDFANFTMVPNAKKNKEKL